MKSLKLTSIIAALCAVLIAIGTFTMVNATDYPSPPKIPSEFRNHQDIQKYLNQLHNYYMVVGRPRYLF